VNTPSIEHSAHITAYVANRLQALATAYPIDGRHSKTAHSLVPTIVIQAREKGAGKLQSFHFRKQIPQGMSEVLSHAIAHCWDWYAIHNTCEIAPAAFTLQQTQAVEHKVTVRKNVVHDIAGIRLHREQVALCAVTGISFIVQLPTPARLQLLVEHPLASYDNVAKLIQSYYKTA